MKKIVKKMELGGRTLTLTTGQLAPQADISVLAQYGETVVLATVTSAPLTEELDYFPLSVEYQERLYAGGRIKGSRFIKREGRPTDEEILSGRLIDRSIRPLFPKTYKKDVQVIATVLSVDMENDPTITASIATSAALAASSIPWSGPVAVSSVGIIDGNYILNPTTTQASESKMDLTLSLTDKAIIMIEAGASQVSEEEILNGIDFAVKEGKKLMSVINDFAKEVGNEKEEFEPKKYDSAITKKVHELLDKNLPDLVRKMSGIEGRNTDWEDTVTRIKAEFPEENANEVLYIMDDIKKEFIRENILKGNRPDGRKLNEIRKLSSEVGVLPRTHGSAVFQRGGTQVMSIVTLGTLSMGQLLESAEGESEKKYIHHYIMPPFSTGETGRVGNPSRREIGHGALAERALLPVVPGGDVFPYAIRVVSEVLSSNGSTSMASTCGSTLSLMDAGVPIKSPVSGIAMGLVIESEKKFAIMRDIAGIEDFNGDMDFKVAGTKDGITALQLDVKTLGLTPKIMKEAIMDAKEGRAEILAHMLGTIESPRPELSEYAPKVKSMKIDVEKIGEVIGASGKVIKKIIADSGAQVDIEEDGTVSVSGTSSEALEKAIKMINGIIKDPERGEIYEGEVKRIQPFGVFVEILPGKEGMVHISDMSREYVGNPEDVVTLGQKIEVRVKEVDNMGRLNLSMVLDPSYDQEKEQNGSGGGRRGNGGGGGGRFDRPGMGGRRGFGGGHDRNDRRPRLSGRRPGFDVRDREGEQGGPHFPASRLVSSDAPKRRFER